MSFARVLQHTQPQRGHVSAYTRQVHRSVIPMMILYKMGIRTHRINIVSLTRIKLRQIIQVDCCFYGTVRCVFYNSSRIRTRSKRRDKPIEAWVSRAGILSYFVPSPSRPILENTSYHSRAATPASEYQNDADVATNSTNTESVEVSEEKVHPRSSMRTAI